MKLAYAGGVNLFDNAETYAAGEAEKIMGAAVQSGIADGVWSREDLVLTTKVFFGTKPGPNNKGLSRKHIVEGTLASLKRMQLDYVDVLFCHRPDPVTPVEEIVRAMNHVVDRGLAFYWGTSEWSAAELAEAIGVADRLGLIRPCVEQPEYSLVARQRVEVEYAPIYELSGMGLTVWSPLASGILTGKYSGRHAPPGSRLTLSNYAFLATSKFGADAWQVDAADELVAIAKEVGCTAAQLAIAWILFSNKRVSTVLLGATSAAQLQENLAALEVLAKMTPELAARCEAIGGGRAAPKAHSSATMVASLRGVAGLANFCGKN
jgi:voltage-dependent potassium channel beta subunit